MGREGRLSEYEEGIGGTTPKPCRARTRSVCSTGLSGKFLKAWLPKASTENERSMVVIETPEGHTVMARQIAGAMARRIVTYAQVGEECYIDEHMGFIKFGSRVDVYLPIGTEPCVKFHDSRYNGHLS